MHEKTIELVEHCDANPYLRPGQIVTEFYGADKILRFDKPAGMTVEEEQELMEFLASKGITDIYYE